jgi:hypothetical protein
VDGVTYLTEHIPYARVCLTPKTDCGTGYSGVTIKVTANESILAPGTNFGIQRFGFNYVGVKTDIVATVTGADATKAAKWSVVANNSQVDGFGTFVEVAAPTTKPGDYRLQPLVISICSSVKDLYVSDFVVPNAPPQSQHFAVHIAGFTTVNGTQYYYVDVEDEDGDGDRTDLYPLTSAFFANCGELTAIGLSSFTAVPGNSVTLNWVTETELDTSGFNILRADKKKGVYEPINEALIPSEGSATQGASYKFVDNDVQKGKKYFYKLEDIDMNGTSTLHGPVKVKIKKK